jgi:hypothetical protein
MIAILLLILDTCYWILDIECLIFSIEYQASSIQNQAIGPRNNAKKTCLNCFAFGGFQRKSAYQRNNHGNTKEGQYLMVSLYGVCRTGSTHGIHQKATKGLVHCRA